MHRVSLKLQYQYIAGQTFGKLCSNIVSVTRVNNTIIDYYYLDTLTTGTSKSNACHSIPFEMCILVHINF